MNSIFTSLKDSFTAWNTDNASTWAASLSYFTIFSLGPLLLLLVSILGLFYSQQSASQHISSILQNTLGSKSSQPIQSVLSHNSKASEGIFGSIIGIIFLLVGASGAFLQLKKMLDHLWGVAQRPRKGLWGLIRDRFLNLALIVVIAFILLISFVASTLIALFVSYLHGLIPLPPLFTGSINFVLSLAITMLLFALIFKILPDVVVKWKDIWIGAFTTAILFTIGQLLIGWYIGVSSVTSTYGAAGSLIALLLWLYYDGLILFYGAEYTKITTIKTTGEIIPSKYGKLVRDVVSPYQTHSQKKNVIVEKATQLSEEFAQKTVEKTVNNLKNAQQKKKKEHK